MIYRYTRFTAVLLMLIASTGCDKEEKNHNISVLDTSYKEIADKTNRNHSECIPDTEICFTEQEISTAIFDIAGMEMALKMYRMDAKTYPSTQQGLKALVEKPVIPPEPKRYRNGGYISELKKDPWGNDYFYLNPAEHSRKYDIFSAGPDKKPGTCDDIGNWNIYDVSTETIRNCYVKKPE